MMKYILFLIYMNFMWNYFKKYYYIMLIMNLMFMLNFNFLTNYMYMNYYWNNMNYILAMDKFSFILIMLTIWILTLSIFSSNLIFNLHKTLLINIMLLLINILIITFSSMNMIIFYIFFEASLIPLMLIIMGWGMQIDKIQASMYMIFYTLFGSLPLLFMLIYMYMKFNSLMFNFLTIKNSMNFKIYLYMIMNSAFFIKLPMFFLHLWLPKAHVEAPIMGSMILAGIMLKLGSYGIYRNMLIMPKMFMNYNIIFIVIFIFGSLLSGLICMNQTDMKIIVAYSSIVHMNLMMTSMLTIMPMSFKGSIMIMIAHGLCSSGMFYIVNLNYEKIYSRNIFINKGFMSIFPSLTIWWFLIFSSNFAAPLSLNFFGEILLINSILHWNFNFSWIIFLISFLSTCYSIFIFSFSQYGKFNFLKFNFTYINLNNFLFIILHWIPMNLFFMNLLMF